MKFGFVVTIALTLTTGVSFAQQTQPSRRANESCSNVDLRTKTCDNGQRRMPPARHQGNSNFCWAYSLADFYSFTSCTNYSALHIGLAQNIRGAQDTSNDKMTGTFQDLNLGMQPARAHEEIRNSRGVCLESDYSSNRPELRTDNALNRFLAGIWQRRGDPNQFRCPNQAVPNFDFTVSRGNDMRRAIDEMLAADRPAIISYASSILSGSASKPGEPVIDHYSTVVGRRRVGNTCQLLVRESSVVTRSEWEVEDGSYVWVPQEELLRNMNEVIRGDPSVAAAPSAGSGSVRESSRSTPSAR